MTSGTESINLGLISLKAWMSICGDGILVRMVIWHP
ncbi:MAG: hypothetical protein BWY89_01306 [Bacteroidetes bacterium ADurb.BinA012]|nr:MAG: hypothetical protein BWY89_01306 [Bacteroidetes bacterium ADurb.BinA012]